MTVVLAGVGADTTNLGTVAPLYPDGRFEYVPIPEKVPETDEPLDLGSWTLRYDDRTAADLTTRIVPNPADGTPVTGTDLDRWPLHHDPNFEALTYGEHRPGYVDRLTRLDSGDVVGFYAGLREPDGERIHRYLIGYVTVQDVTVLSPEAQPAERADLLAEHPDNAHAKRAIDGQPYYDDRAVVIVDGTTPGGLFERDPIRMSEYRTLDGNVRAQYYLRESFEREFEVVEGRRNMQFKPAYLCDLAGEAFVDRVGVPGERSEVR